jgi:nucleoid-associated protein YgaU
LDDKQGPEQTESLVASSELEKQKGVMRAETASEPKVTLPAKAAVREKAQSAAARTVVAQRNDNLSRIIERAYGRYKDRLLAKVLKENPEILTPDFILAGQVIRLPDLEPTDLND